MISPTMPESPCTDTKIIPDFASVSSYIRTVIFRLLLLRSETALHHRRSLKWIVTYRRDRFLPLFVAVWTGFQVKWVGASMGWDPLIWKYIFRREDCDLVHQTGLSANRPLWCDVRCVWTTFSSSIRIHFHVDTKIYFEYSVDRLKK